jgi:hypothetical protein
MTPEQLRALTDSVDTEIATERRTPRGMTPEQLRVLTDQVDAGTDAPPAPAPQAAPAASPPAPANDYSQYAGTPYNPTAEDMAALENSTVGQLATSVGVGAAKAIWETKDFFAGEPEESDKSTFRKQGEAQAKKLAEASGWNSLAMGASQFAVGILGAGKLTKTLGAGKWVGSLGKSVLDGALAGAVAFDPHEERFSDLVDRFAPNIVTGYLKSNPNDAAWEGRLKNSLESIGLDAAMVGVLAVAGKVLRARKAGDAVAAGKAEGELEAATRKLEETQQGAAQPRVEPSAPSAAPPPVADGFVRLYHGHLADESLAGGGGRWVSPDPEYARNFRSEGTPKEVAYVDIPKDDPALAGAKLWDEVDEAGATNMVGRYGNVELPEEWASKLKPLNESGGSPKAMAADTGAPKSEAVHLEVVDSPTQAGAPRRDAGSPMVTVEDADLGKIARGADRDFKALAAHGSWENAIAAGHTFGKGGSIPWQTLSKGAEPSTAVDAVIARVAETLKPQLDAAKGGKVLSDATVEKQVRDIASFWGEDPGALIGAMRVAGEGAQQSVAMMRAAYMVSQSTMQDAFTMAARIRGGYLGEFGGDRGAAIELLRKQVEVMATTMGAANSIRANAGRALRQNRSEFRLKPEELESLKGLDEDTLVSVLTATGGDPRSLRRLATPSIWQRLMDKTQFLYVNNLLWSPKTHAVNFATNAFMIAARPAQRWMGSFAVGGRAGSAIRMEAVKQYQYMASSLIDGLEAAAGAWRTADSVLSPRSAEAATIGLSTGQEVAAMSFKSWDSLSNVLYNAQTFAVKAAGFPTRGLGTVDELTKQLVYRSKVQASAFVEGTENGLKGADLDAFIRNRLDGAFDEVGRGVDGVALQEARVATFSQDLLSGTMGKSTQAFVNNHPILRFVLPFVKTPTNVFREGIRLTPGLNLLQSEYRSMLSGSLGAERQAQAVGQMAMGSIVMGVAGLMAANGFVTGGGPTDRTQKRSLESTGWRPYSWVFPRADGGKTYIPFNRLDPIAMPFGVVADLVDAMNVADEDDPLYSRIMEGAMAGMFSLVKQMNDKTYLMSINQVVQLLSDGDDQKWSSYFGQTASNLVPGAAGMRLANQDPYMRDARGFVDKIMATIPGLSEKVPARYDIWGEPRGVNKGLWANTPGSAVDDELRRMILEGDVGLAAPSPYVSGIDLRDVQTTEGKNAFEEYQKLAGRIDPKAPSLKDIAAKIIATEGYQKAPDGDSRVKGTKQAMLADVMADYRHKALDFLKGKDSNVREAMLKEQRRVAAAWAGANADAQRGPKTPGIVGQFLDGLGLGASN